jgi:hypothetical protein
MPSAGAPISVLRLLCLALALAVLPATADAAVSRKKAIAGPVEFQGESQFATYAALGAGLYQATLASKRITVQEPADPKDPADPGYDWPPDLDEAVSEGARYHIQVALTVTGEPPAGFFTAAARRYPAVHLWLVAPGRSASAYAAALKGAYAALKARSTTNVVAGQPASERWLTRLTGARMDLYASTPAANKSLRAADLEALHTAVGKDYGKPLKLFLAGWTLQTGRSAAAAQLSAGLKLARKASYVYALGYDGLYDSDKVGTDGRTPKTGLLDNDGTMRPAFAAFKNG